MEAPQCPEHSLSLDSMCEDPPCQPGLSHSPCRCTPRCRCFPSPRTCHSRTQRSGVTHLTFLHGTHFHIPTLVKESTKARPPKHHDHAGEPAVKRQSPGPLWVVEGQFHPAGRRCNASASFPALSLFLLKQTLWEIGYSSAVETPPSES